MTALRRIPMTLSEPAFARLAALVRKEAGLSLSYGKAPMICSRLRPQAERLGFDDFQAYVAFMCSDRGTAEREWLISSLTTNVSQFFREPHHFEILTRDVIEELRARAAQGHALRIWSAGCSTGQEPYSLAMHLLDVAPDLCRGDLLILASDIDAPVLEHARRALYGAEEVESLPEPQRTRFLLPVPSCDARPVWQIAADVRRLVRFKQLNLMQDWPMSRPFDVIFCRNVIIYFDEETRDTLVQRFHRALRPDGWLFLGHSERTGARGDQLFASRGATAYRAQSPATVSASGRAAHGA